MNLPFLAILGLLQVEKFSWAPPSGVGAQLTMGDQGNGTYAAHFRFTVSGVFLVPFLFDGVELEDSPASIIVVPGAMSPNRSTVSGTGLTDLASYNRIHVQPNDRFGNHIP